MCGDPLAGVRRGTRRGSPPIDLFEHLIELVPALEHAVDEGGEALASLLRHHGFHEREADGVEALGRDLIGPAQGFVRLGLPALLKLAKAV